MVFNVTFNNISVISWISVLLVEEIGIPEGKSLTFPSLHHICFGKDIAGTGSGECVRADIQAW
jgi:hypothetical protein